MIRVLAALYALLALLAPALVQAEDETPKSLEIVASPIFGTGTLPGGGWGEVVVRMTNHGKEPYRGKARVYGGLSSWSDEEQATADAPFSVGAGASVSLRIPVRVSDHQDPAIKVYDDKGAPVFQQSFVRIGDNRSILVDVAKTSALGAAIRGVVVGSRTDPWGAAFRGYPTSAPSTVEVTSPIYDAVTGDPLLPQRAAGYARVSAVLVRSEELSRLAASELEALAGFVLAGGTVAIVITRPEDLRDPVVVSFCGDAIRPVKPQSETLDALDPVAPSGSLGAKGLSPQPQPEPYLDGRLHSYEGGNLRPSLYGGSAPYGLGEVHILAFDPQTKPAVDSGWVHLRVVDMMRRANERLSSVLFRPGEPHTITGEVRRQLDPNEGSRWAIVITALMLLAYSVAAGPANFMFWRRKGKPLKALIWLPAMSALTFGAVVGVGVIAKGCSGRSRHLTVVEAGAGMESGTARRWRGFYVPSAQEMTIRTSHASSILGTEVTGGGEEVKDDLVVDRDGLRLVGVRLRPWETVVVREDGVASLGAGITILPHGSGEARIVNKTGRRLLGLVLRLANGDTLYRESLADAEELVSSDMDRISRVVIPGAGTMGGMTTTEFDPYAVSQKLNVASDGLTQAWAAVNDAITARKDWFPPDVPVLLAQVQGGEGVTNDSGLDIDSDRFLVRIVGYGGEP